MEELGIVRQGQIENLTGRILEHVKACPVDFEHVREELDAIWLDLVLREFSRQQGIEVEEEDI